jgi:hypothetical protein
MAEVAITIRIPEELKDTVDAYATARGLSQAAAVRLALQHFVAPRTERVYELPGMSSAFTAFLEDPANEWALLLVDTGARRFQVEGRVQRMLVNESVVSLIIRGDSRPTAFLRRDVVAWFPGDDRSNQLAMSLLRHGWEPYHADTPLEVDQRRGRRTRGR